MYSTRFADIGGRTYSAEFKELDPILQAMAEAAEGLRLASEDLYVAAAKTRNAAPEIFERIGMTSLLVHQLWQQTEELAGDTVKSLEGAGDSGGDGRKS